MGASFLAVVKSIYYDMSIAVNQTPKAFLGAKLLISVIVRVTIAGIHR